jgi:hypothetical protein
MKRYVAACSFSLLVTTSAFAQCDPTMLRSHYISCMTAQQQAQTGVMPHQSTFQQPMLQRPGSVYQQQAPNYYQAPTQIYQAPAPLLQQEPPALWAPANRNSSYR